MYVPLTGAGEATPGLSVGLFEQVHVGGVLGHLTLELYGIAHLSPAGVLHLAVWVQLTLQDELHLPHSLQLSHTHTHTHTRQLPG